jgi:acetyl-CoA carboxylase biotin carboxyl carrier protein
MTTLLDHAAEIAAWLAATDIDVLELDGPDGRLRLVRSGRHAARVEEASPVESTDGPELSGEGHDTIRSPGVGHVLHAHPLHETPLAQPGTRVAAGQAVALLKIGAMLIPIPASSDGVVAAFVAPDQSLVGFGDPILDIRPA